MSQAKPILAEDSDNRGSDWPFLDRLRIPHTLAVFDYFDTKRVGTFSVPLKYIYLPLKSLDYGPHQFLIQKVVYYKIREVPLMWVELYLSNRKQFIGISDVRSGEEC